MPTIGRSSASSVKPAPLRKPRRRNSANSSSPYWARRDRNPFVIINSDRPRLPRAGCPREGGRPHCAIGPVCSTDKRSTATRDAGVENVKRAMRRLLRPPLPALHRTKKCPPEQGTLGRVYRIDAWVDGGA